MTDNERYRDKKMTLDELKDYAKDELGAKGAIEKYQTAHFDIHFDIPEPIEEWLEENAVVTRNNTSVQSHANGFKISTMWNGRLINPKEFPGNHTRIAFDKEWGNVYIYTKSRGQYIFIDMALDGDVR